MKNFPLPLRYSIPLILIFFGGLFSISSFNQEINETYKRTEINTKNYLRISAGQTSTILDYLYRRSDIEDAETSIVSQLGSDPNINVLMVIDEEDIIHVSNRYELKNNHISNTVVAAYTSKLNNVRATLAGEVLLSQDKQKLIAIYPILLQALPDEISPSRVGILFFEYDLTRAKQQAFSDVLKRSLMFNIFLAIFCLGLWLFFDLTLTRRVSLLVAASHSLAEGNFNVRTKLSGSDEIVQISVAFDHMASKIQENTLILQQELTKREIIETKLKETNEQLSSSNIELALLTKAKSEFLSNMSHEIRTPMNGVICMAELLSMKNLSEEQKDIVQTIRDSGNALLVIINDILDFSKIESGNLQLEEHQFNLEDIIKSVFKLFSTQAATKNINLEYSINSDVPTNLLADATRLRQILLNLIGNAIKFTEQGHVSIKVLVIQQQEDQKIELMISIKDTGIGIEHDRLNQLFQPFTQADTSISRKYGGTGLGLAISKSLVNLMGGKIWVESLGNIGGHPPENWLLNWVNNYLPGSIFYFTFIAKAVLPDGLISEKSSQVFPVTTITEISPLKILLAEDNKVNQKVVLLTLKKLGYSADIANNGLEVLKKIETEVYDVILMDMQMPEMDGIAATQIIRQSAKIQPYIIALTANALDADRQICLDVGMNDYISKPIIMADFEEALKNAETIKLPKF
ncbi:ATP-binding protein [Anabaena azotica]|uniref:ATP-binding protein n=1 Tax=Anabaena azotica TaxID=197653 RepID=UPI0039A6EE6F